jgi:hypothetical protein
MKEEEWQDEVRRRDEIIDANKGIELDFLYADAKLQAIKCIIESSASEREKLKMARALIIYA